jgi:GT2 family glycosyltransferase
VVAVVVTWNRRELLQESLAAVHGQTHPPAAIVVVDNASDDGTSELLDSAYAVELGLDVVHLRQNTGGAGGFAVGVERALGHHPDLVWLLDDDDRGRWVGLPVHGGQGLLEQLAPVPGHHDGDDGRTRHALHPR